MHDTSVLQTEVFVELNTFHVSSYYVRVLHMSKTRDK